MSKMMDVQHFSTMLIRKWNQERDAMLAPQDLGCFFLKAALIFGEVSPWSFDVIIPQDGAPGAPVNVGSRSVGAKKSG